MPGRQAIVNPEEVRRFAAALKRYNEEITNSTRRVQGQFRQLGSTWRDQEYKRFEQEFQQATNAIRRFLNTSEQYTQYLKRKAEAAQRYLDQV